MPAAKKLASTMPSAASCLMRVVRMIAAAKTQTQPTGDARADQQCAQLPARQQKNRSPRRAAPRAKAHRPADFLAAAPRSSPPRHSMRPAASRPAPPRAPYRSAASQRAPDLSGSKQNAQRQQRRDHLPDAPLSHAQPPAANICPAMQAGHAPAVCLLQVCPA